MTSDTFLTLRFNWWNGPGTRKDSVPARALETDRPRFDGHTGDEYLRRVTFVIEMIARGLALTVVVSAPNGQGFGILVDLKNIRQGRA